MKDNKRLIQEQEDFYTKDNNLIKLKDIQNLFNKVFKAGYEETIDLKINGEYYKIIKE